MLHLPSIRISFDEASGNDGPVNEGGDGCYNQFDDGYGKKCSESNKFNLHELDSSTAQALHELVALIHKHVNPSQTVDSLQDTQSADGGKKDELNKTMKVNIFNLEEDPIATILWTLRPHAVQSLFLAVAHNFPRTLEALMLHALSPVGAEVITRKFEEMDQLIGQEERNHFYKIFYGVFEDQYGPMQALLGGKESFARQAFKNVLDQYLGVAYSSDPS